VSQVEKGADWGSVGGHAQVTMTLLGRPFTSELELTTWDPPYEFRYTVRQPGRPDVDNRRTYRPVAGGTLMRGTSEAVPRGGVAGVMDRVQALGLQRTMDAAMAKLTTVVTDEDRRAQ